MWAKSLRLLRESVTILHCNLLPRLELGLDHLIKSTSESWIMRKYREVVTTPSSAVTTFSYNPYTQACTAVHSAAPSCCVQQIIGQVQPGCGGISFHLYAICQQNSSSPTSVCGSRRAGGEMWRRAKVTAPLTLSPRYSGKCGDRGQLLVSVVPHGRPIEATPPPCLTSSSPWGAHLGGSLLL